MAAAPVSIAAWTKLLLRDHDPEVSSDRSPPGGSRTRGSCADRMNVHADDAHYEMRRLLNTSLHDVGVRSPVHCSLSPMLLRQQRWRGLCSGSACSCRQLLAV